MPISQSEIDDTVDFFSAIGPVTTRKMMGGLTVFFENRAFAIYDPTQGYFLKSDKHTHAIFEAEGLLRFVAGEKNGMPQTMNYYAMPENAYDDPDHLRQWTRHALDAALRAKPKKR